MASNKNIFSFILFGKNQKLMANVVHKPLGGFKKA
jgi:hypothetical protein